MAHICHKSAIFGIYTTYANIITCLWTLISKHILRSQNLLSVLLRSLNDKSLFVLIFTSFIIPKKQGLIPVFANVHNLLRGQLVHTIFYIEEDIKRLDEKLAELKETIDRTWLVKPDPYRMITTTRDENGEI